MQVHLQSLSERSRSSTKSKLRISRPDGTREFTMRGSAKVCGVCVRQKNVFSREIGLIFCQRELKRNLDTFLHDAAPVRASGVNAFISHRTHRIHRILFIIPFTLVFNSQNLQVASPLLGHPGWMPLSRAKRFHRCNAALTVRSTLTEAQLLSPCEALSPLTVDR